MIYVCVYVYVCSYICMFLLFFLYLSLKAFHKDGHQQIEQDVVPKGHQGHKVESRPGRGGGHAVIQHDIPVLLGQNLWQ